jgi:hypothetical protein
MRATFYGLVFEVPRVSFYLWSPWRASALEHRLFEVLRRLPQVSLEEGPDEMRLHITDPQTYQNALVALERVLKGWQEEADPGSERRHWRWLLEGDTDASGYDHTGAPVSLWGFLRVTLERGGLGELEKSEDLDLEDFGFEVPGEPYRRR